MPHGTLQMGAVKRNSGTYICSFYPRLYSVHIHINMGCWGACSGLLIIGVGSQNYLENLENLEQENDKGSSFQDRIPGKEGEVPRGDGLSGRTAVECLVLVVQ